MYHPTVIKKRLIAAQKSCDFKLQYHTVSKCQEWIEHLDGIRDDDGRLTRPLEPEEHRWIKNERKLVKCDFSYAATRYFKIINEVKVPVTFTFRIPQKMNLEIWAEHELNGWEIAIIQLKARQLGMSTLTELAIGHRVFFWPYSYAVIASSDPEKSAEMAGMLEFVYDNLPWWLAPECTKRVAGKELEFKGLTSKVSIQHGNKLSGIARGRTPNLVHLSELPDFDNPGELVDASLLPAVHPSPNVFFIMESTGKGFDWWYKSWKRAKANWPQKSRFRHVFLPWYTGTDIKPTPTFIKQFPIPPNWDPQSVTLKHAERAKNYVANYPLLQKFLGQNYEVPRHQLWWWEFTREDYYDKRELNKFLEENPADDLEAFQSPTTSVFSVEEMESFGNDIREPLEVFAITADDIPSRFHPYAKEMLNQPPFTVRCPWYAFDAKFHPMRWRGYEQEGEGWQGKLLVWERPIPGETYSLGIDTSYGLGQDRSVIQVIRKSSDYRFDEQVAEFSSSQIGAEELWPFAMAIGLWYSFGRRQARQVVECNALGRVVQFELTKRGWANFHPWVHIDRKHVRPGKASLIGWFTNTKTRHEMMAKSVRALKDGLLEINSKYLVEEMQGLQKDEDDASISSEYGYHDDRFMSLGFAYYSTHFMEVERLARTRKPGPPEMPTYATSVSRSLATVPFEEMLERNKEGW